MTGRIGDLALANHLRGLVLDGRGRLQEAQMQIASGKAAQRFEAISRDAALYLRTADLKVRLEGQTADALRLMDRLNAMEGALGNLAGIAEHIRATLLHRLNDPTGPEMPLDLLAAELLDQVARQLNLQLDGRHLFAGSRTDAPPVVLPEQPINTADAGLYYRGDGVVLSARIDGDGTVRYGVTADQEGFAKLIAGLGLVIEGHRAGDREQLAAALDMVGDAIDDIAAYRGRLGAALRQVEVVHEDHGGRLLYLDDTLARIGDADIPGLMLRLAQDQLLLEASFAVIGQLSRLSLVDHLR